MDRFFSHFISVCILLLFMNLCFVLSSYLSRERSPGMHVDRQTFTCYSCVGMLAVVLFLYQISSITWYTIVVTRWQLACQRIDAFANLTCFYTSLYYLQFISMSYTHTYLSCQTINVLDLLLKGKSMVLIGVYYQVQALNQMSDLLILFSDLCCTLPLLLGLLYSCCVLMKYIRILGLQQLPPQQVTQAQLSLCLQQSSIHYLLITSNHLCITMYRVSTLEHLQDVLIEFDILVFSEIWLNHSVERYQNPERKDRECDIHGGVIIYVKEGIYFKRRMI